MSIDKIQQELGVMQLSDSFFPTGIFTTSNGLEFLFKEKKIHGTLDLIDLIKINIIQQIGPTDCVALANTIDSANKKNFNKIIDADKLVFAIKSIKEIRNASVRSGVQLIKCVSEFIKDDKILDQYKDGITNQKIHGVFPVAYGICCNSLNIKKEKGMAMMLYGFSVGVIGAALRLGLIQHMESQKIIHSIKPTISKTVRGYSNTPLLEMWQFAPQMDLFQMSHEKMDSKMFIT